jgi:hypothetical protein
MKRRSSRERVDAVSGPPGRSSPIMHRWCYRIITTGPPRAARCPRSSSRLAHAREEASRIAVCRLATSRLSRQHRRRPVEIVVYDGALRRFCPRQPVDPRPMRARPTATREMEPPSQQQLAQSMPAPLQILSRVVACRGRIANGFVGRTRSGSWSSKPLPSRGSPPISSSAPSAPALSALIARAVEKLDRYGYLRRRARAPSHCSCAFGVHSACQASVSLRCAIPRTFQCRFVPG